MPIDAEIIYQIRRFGAEAILPTPIDPELARRLAITDNLITAWQARAHYRDGNGNRNDAEWAELNPDMNNEILQALGWLNDAER